MFVNFKLDHVASGKLPLGETTRIEHLVHIKEELWNFKTELWIIKEEELGIIKEELWIIKEMLQTVKDVQVEHPHLEEKLQIEWFLCRNVEERLQDLKLCGIGNKDFMFFDD